MANTQGIFTLCVCFSIKQSLKTYGKDDYVTGGLVTSYKYRYERTFGCIEWYDHRGIPDSVGIIFIAKINRNWHLFYLFGLTIDHIYAKINLKLQKGDSKYVL